MMESCNRFGLLLLLMLALAAVVVAMITDYWYEVESEGSMTPEEKQSKNYRFGLWRQCYAQRPPDSLLKPGMEKSGDNCVWIYKELIQDHESELPSRDMLRLHLMRSVLGLSITSAACLLFTVMSLLCAWVPGNCDSPSKTRVYISAAIIVLVALLAAIASGICFMAARDVERRDLNLYRQAGTQYLWSFALHWVGTGLILLSGCLTLFLMANSTKEVNSKKQSHYYYS